MANSAVRSTLYLDPALHQALRLKSAATHRSMSEIVNAAVRAALSEDQEDLTAFAERAHEPSMSYEAFLDQLRSDGTL
jgi:plasmid stability protein